MKKEITGIFVATIKKFRDALAVFTEVQVNKIPFEGSWTAAQVADHILRSQSRFPELVTGNTKEVERPVDEKKDWISNVFLNFSSKLKSPEFILPSGEPLNKTELLNRIDERISAIKNAMELNDLNRECLDFELPVMGTLTGLEWSWFLIFHMQRHTRQLENIYSIIHNAEEKLAIENQ